MASRKTSEMKQRLLEERDRVLRQRDALDNHIAGLERAIALIDDDAARPGAGQPGRRASTKRMVLDLLREVGTTGLNAATAVEIADRRGFTLDRGSVSSLLSRLKKDGIVVHDGDRYRLKEFAPSRKPDPSQESRSQPFTVVDLPSPRAQHGA